MKPTAIITSDIGLQEGQPVCRLDDYWEVQVRKIKWLKDLQEKYNCPILDGGDLFEHWKPTPNLLRWAIDNLPNNIITIPGNHDLPAHNLDLYDKSGLAVLEAAKKIRVLKDMAVWPLDLMGLHPNYTGTDIGIVGFPWGFKPDEISPLYEKNIALIHTMTHVGRTFPGDRSPNALALLKQMKGFDLIVAGHNHQHFIVSYEGLKLISPGSLIRTTADQADYKPHVFLWYAETNDIEAVPVPIEEGVISREHLDKITDRDERMEAFVSKLNGEMEIGLSFEKNTEEYFSKHRVRQAVQDIVWESIEREEDIK